LFFIRRLSSYDILILYSGLHHLLQLFSSRVSRPQVYLQASNSVLGNLKVVLELVIFSMKICGTKISSDTKIQFDIHKVMGGWPYQRSQMSIAH
jgi:hypothetical protein